MTPRAESRDRGQRRGRGQSLVEFTIVLPGLIILLFLMIDMGFAFADTLTMGNATREGARIGAAMATGSSTTCTGDPKNVDKMIIGSVQNILKSAWPGSKMERISEIRIYKANAAGAQIGSSANVWKYTPGAGADIDPGTGVEILDFSPVSTAWAACTRKNGGSSPDSIAVKVTYTYRMVTPLGVVLDAFSNRPFFGDCASQGRDCEFELVDRTVMALNPTS